jgi:energy-coupling factor transporter ATP-binding protein EcfA2
LEDDDLQKINILIESETPFRKAKDVIEIVYYRYYRYENSKFVKLDSRWSGFHGWLKEEPEEKYVLMAGENYADINSKLADYCNKLIPSILYFPNFLFDFPSQIFLESTAIPSAKEKFYIELVQDILFSLENNTSIKTHLVDRIKSTEESDKKSLDRLIQLMERKITDVVFDAWNRIFKRQIKETRIVINYNINAEGLSFLEFEIEAEDGIYQINERSLGFRWFFIFLLFTQFRPFRKETPKNIIFLFDEPASNLHSSAQKQLLESFESLIQNSKIIYTTHSHYLINPYWLESTYVVKNDGLNLENPEIYNIKKTKITIEPYRSFVVKHPYNTAYFQPILDILDYSPSSIENLPNSILLEGKNDFYTLAYFKDVILNFPESLNFAPSTGSGNLDTLISLYFAWGRNFIVLLDSDQEGSDQKTRYIDKFGILVENRIFTIQDIAEKFYQKKLEDLFEMSDLINFQQTCYPDSNRFKKIHFFRAIQESLCNKRVYNFSDQTKENFRCVLEFLFTNINLPCNQ